MRFLLGCAVLSCAALFSSPERPVFTRLDKAFFADPKIVNFVRPGLLLKINSVAVGADGAISAAFSVTDLQGLGLDVAGVTTPGVIAPSFVASYIPPGANDYVPITSRAQTGPVSGAVRQAGTDAGGTLRQTGDGQYTYVFATKIPAEVDPASTVTVGVYATRNLTEFDLGTNAANAILNVTPSGAAPTAVHDVVHPQTCNKCHGNVSAPPLEP